MSDGILSGLDPQAIAEHFGEVDTEYTWLQEPQTMTHSDEVAQLRARIADLERNSVIRTDNGAVIVALEKRIAELERERDYLSDCYRCSEKELNALKTLREERDAAIADARKLAQNWNGVMTSVELEAIVKKYLQQ